MYPLSITLSIIMNKLAILFCFINAIFAFEKVVKMSSPFGKDYLLINEKMSRAEAPKACIGKGGRLAQLESEDEFQWLSDAIKTTAWVESWQGKTYGGSCIAFYTGGAIAIPLGNCGSKQMVLCDLNKLK